MVCSETNVRRTNIIRIFIIFIIRFKMPVGTQLFKYVLKIKSVLSVSRAMHFKIKRESFKRLN